jgi:tetratricopeptide (TPR) repeat protein
MDSPPTIESSHATSAGSLTQPSRTRALATNSRLLLAGRAAAVVLLAFAIYFAVREGVAGWYFEKNLPQDIETAAKWDSRNPQFPDALAQLMRFYSENPNPAPLVRLCETAVRLSPNDAHYWADLGSAYDWAGRPNDALHAFERARELFPNSPDINWSLANFYVRAGRLDDSLPLLQRILASSVFDQNQVFSLATRATANADVVIKEVLPAHPPFLENYFNFLIASNNLDAAKTVWSRLLESKQPFDLTYGVSYVNALIQHPDVDAASEVWSQLVARFPKEMNPRLTSPNLVTNGNFVLPILNGGFDWRVFPIEGATVSVLPANPDTGGSLQIEFDGAHNVDYAHVLQFIRVEPKTRYAFTGEIRTRGVTTDSGPRFQIFDPQDMAHLFVSSENRIGTSDWWNEKLSFQTGAATRIVILRVVRPASSKFDNQLAGDVWIRHISIMEEKH